MNDDFFRLGGNSLSAMKLALQIAGAFNYDFRVKDVFLNSTIKKIAELIIGSKDIQVGRERILALNLNKYPLSYEQERLWFIDNFDGPSYTYNIPVVLDFYGFFDIEVFNKSINFIVRRHAVFQSIFNIEGENVYQFIQSDMVIKPNVKFISENDLDHEIEKESMHVFNLSEGPLVRFILFKISEEHLCLFINMHHIISDGWSIGLFFKELSQIYSSFVKGQVPILQSLPIQYGDFAIWQRSKYFAIQTESQLHYWRNNLKNYVDLNLPIDKRRPQTMTNNGGSYCFVVENNVLFGIRKIIEQEQVSLFMYLFAVYSILLSKLSVQNDIVIGSLVANRSSVEVEGLIGFFVNNISLRIVLKEDMDFFDVLKAARKTCLDAYHNQQVPFEKVVEEVVTERDFSKTPIFQVMLVLQNNAFDGEVDSIEFANLNWAKHKAGKETAKFDLLFEFTERKDDLACSIQYNTDLYLGATIERIAKYFLNALNKVMTSPYRKVCNLSLLSDSEWKRLNSVWNNTDFPFPLGNTFVEHFRNQVAITPNKIAVRCQGQSLTYAKLNSLSNSLARGLCAKGIVSETPVILFLDRGNQYLVSLLATLKAGGAFVPLDPKQPIMKNVGVLNQFKYHKAIIITDSSNMNHLRTLDLGCMKIMDINEVLSCGIDNSDFFVTATPKNLAYILFTSGTTGVPKGAMIQNDGMLNHIFAKINDLNLSSADIVAQTASHIFDISIWQFLAPLLVGGEVIIYTGVESWAPDKLLQNLRRDRVTIFETVPSHISTILETINGATDLRFNCLRWLMLTGEALPINYCKKWFDFYPNIPIINAYGPTECSDDVTHFVLKSMPENDWHYAPINGTIANMKIYVLDAYLNPLPPGVIGELYIGGVGVGRGYFDDKAKTADSFINNPFSNDPSSKLYKTGDLVRYDKNGILEFMSRADHQIKIRGFRIELGEIEEALLMYPGIAQCIVAAMEENNQKQLVAYCTFVPDLKNKPDSEQIKRHLKNKLAEYAVPSFVVILDSMPLNSNGKIDRKQLPKPQSLDLSSSVKAKILPHNRIERMLFHIWQDVLGSSPLGIDDDFFLVGGSSLLAVNLMLKVNHTFNLKKSVAWIFTENTIKKQAMAIFDTKFLSQYKPIYQFNENSGKTPLIFIHPGLAGAENYFGLASVLNKNQPFYIIDYYNLYSGEKYLETVEDIASKYIGYLRSLKIKGKICIGGWSLGGLIAYEMARRLDPQEMQVSAVLMIDTFLLNNEDVAFRDKISNLMGDGFWDNVVYEHHKDKIKEISSIEGQMTKNYKPRRYDGKLVLYKCINPNLTANDAKHYELNIMREYWQYLINKPTNGWMEIAPQISVKTIDCHHLTVLQPGNLKMIAALLEDDLNKLNLVS
ncbi:MAG: amino acid adenylation domain-containing protein [Gammaproteobacteria bacterium]|nr:amino acid adenylation domain-containing protein [Gammaproteobacteria bacterium]